MEWALDKKYELPTVSFGSELVRVAFDLERLRGNFGIGTTPAPYLFELHSLFQVLMSVISARIEGNRTTIYDALRKIEESDHPTREESQLEILNLLKAMEFIDNREITDSISHVFVRELHRIAVEGLTREGDATPGQYRKSEVGISRSSHAPPSHVYVHSEMNDLIDFANSDVNTSEQMIHVAIAHHRFLWIHPFTNGNGRVSRLLSYAMLRRHGFVSPVGLRTVNPTAVFGNDREEYYEALAAADDLSNAGTVEWCTYFVKGILGDMERLTRLQDFEFTFDNLFKPTAQRMLEAGLITAAERDAVLIAIGKVVVKAGDLTAAFPGSASQRSVAIHQLLEKGILVQDTRGPRFYKVPLTRPPFAPFLVRQLDALGYLPKILREDEF